MVFVLLLFGLAVGTAIAPAYYILVRNLDIKYNYVNVLVPGVFFLLKLQFFVLCSPDEILKTLVDDKNR